MRVRVAACAAMTAAAIAAPAASAATLTVNSTFDETNSGDGSCSLREAILAVDSPGSAGGDCAPAAFGANTIVLKAGRYFLGGAAPHTELQIASTVTNLTIQGAGESQTTIDASLLGSRVFEVAPGAGVTMRDLKITGGHAADGTVRDGRRRGRERRRTAARSSTRGRWRSSMRRSTPVRPAQAAPAGPPAAQRATRRSRAALEVTVVKAVESSTPER